MRLFGLIGFPLSHSFSKKYFIQKFEKEGLENCEYRNFPIASIAELKNILHDHPQLEGFNVTIPYKQQVVSFLHYASPVVQVIGACNCIRIKNHKLYGYNTDITGFRKSLEKKLKPHHTRALILGTGGAAKAVEYVLSHLGIRFRVVTRNKKSTHLHYNEIDRLIIEQHSLIINTTPLGTAPALDEAPAIPYQFLSPDHYLFDLVYNPEKTKFLQLGEERGAAIENGADMLVIQAEESWKIWNDQS